MYEAKQNKAEIMSYKTATHKITIKKPGIDRGMTLYKHDRQMNDFYHWATKNGFDIDLERLQPVDSEFAIDSAKFLFNLND